MTLQTIKGAVSYAFTNPLQATKAATAFIWNSRSCGLGVISVVGIVWKLCSVHIAKIAAAKAASEVAGADKKLLKAALIYKKTSAGTEIKATQYIQYAAVASGALFMLYQAYKGDFRLLPNAIEISTRFGTIR